MRVRLANDEKRKKILDHGRSDKKYRDENQISSRGW